MSADPTSGDGVAARRRLVAAFLGRCRAWGTEREIPATLERLRAAPTPGDAARLHQWTTWVSFLDHAVGELDRGELDAWLTPDEPAPMGDPPSPVAGPGRAG
jgi:hypothetical protein